MASAGWAAQFEPVYHLLECNGGSSSSLESSYPGTRNRLRCIATRCIEKYAIYHKNDKYDKMTNMTNISNMNYPPDRQIASLTVQCRQVYCLVEMAPSAPSWRPPHHGVSSTASQAGERPNQCRHTTLRPFQHTQPSENSQKKNSTI